MTIALLLLFDFTFIRLVLCLFLARAFELCASYVGLFCRNLKSEFDESGRSLSLTPAHVDALSRHVSWTGSREGERLERGFTFLATTGSSAPFIGLFGTVIGIINAFEGIGRAGSASLAVVAPGIAEALIATAMGLFAAIPATIFYNIFVGRLRNIVNAIDLFAVEYQSDLRRMATADAE